MNYLLSAFSSIGYDNLEICGLWRLKIIMDKLICQIQILLLGIWASRSSKITVDGMNASLLPRGRAEKEEFIESSLYLAAPMCQSGHID